MHHWHEMDDPALTLSSSQEIDASTTSSQEIDTSENSGLLASAGLHRRWNCSELSPDEYEAAEVGTTTKTSVPITNGTASPPSDLQCFLTINANDTVSFDEVDHPLLSKNDKIWAGQHRSCLDFLNSPPKRSFGTSKGLKNAPRITVALSSLAKKVSNRLHTHVDLRDDPINDDTNVSANQKEAELRDGPPTMKSSREDVPETKMQRGHIKSSDLDDAAHNISHEDKEDDKATTSTAEGKSQNETILSPKGGAELACRDADIQNRIEMTNESPKLGSMYSEISMMADNLDLEKEKEAERTIRKECDESAVIVSKLQKRCESMDRIHQLTSQQTESSQITNVGVRDNLDPSNKSVKGEVSEDAAHSSKKCGSKHYCRPLLTASSVDSTPTTSSENVKLSLRAEGKNADHEKDDQRTAREIVPYTKEQGSPSNSSSNEISVETAEENDLADLRSDSKGDQASDVAGKQKETDNSADRKADGESFKEPTEDVSMREVPLSPRVAQEKPRDDPLEDQLAMIPDQKRIVSFSKFEDVRYYVQETNTDLVHLGTSLSSTDNSEGSIDGLRASSSDSEASDGDQRGFIEEGCTWTALVAMSEIQRLANELKPYLTSNCMNLGETQREQETDDAGDTYRLQSAVSLAINSTK